MEGDLGGGVRPSLRWINQGGRPQRWSLRHGRWAGCLVPIKQCPITREPSLHALVPGFDAQHQLNAGHCTCPDAFQYCLPLMHVRMWAGGGPVPICVTKRYNGKITPYVVLTCIVAASGGALFG